jgi:hypothetical protein
VPIGLTFVFAPSAVMAFYRGLGMRLLDRWGPGLVRALGVVFLAFVAMFIAAIAIAGLGQ